MLLAHLTDLHLPMPAVPALTDLLNKRALGYLSWRGNRRKRHTLTALETLVADCGRDAPDFTVLSGDLVNIALESEFTAAAQWLAAHFSAATTVFTPGNHDAYVAVPWDRGLGNFRPFMTGARLGQNGDRPPRDASDFPFVRTVGAVCVVFANSSPPTAPGLATGCLGGAQIDRIGAELRRLGEEEKCRVLVLHHPVTEGVTSRRKALDDAAALRALLKETGVELVLHGHTHRSVWASVDTKDGPRPVVGGASASHPRAHGKYRPARYNLFTIEGDARRGWRIDVVVKELDPETGAVRTAEERRLLPAP